MTENEEIKKVINGLNFLKEKLYNGIYADRLDCIDYAISALKEIQRYREIGASPERITELILEGSAAKRILGHYQKIGTVEECRKAAEKQKPKKPKLNYKPRFLGKATYTCPKCGNCCLEEFANERQNNNYCWDCGQAIRWVNENLEGMEDE